jgi:hypothetical protein
MGTRHRSFGPLTLLWVAGFTLAASSVVPVRASSSSNTISRFFSRAGEPLREYRAYRHLHAVNDRFNQEAWLEAWTEVKNGRFSYEIVNEKGSEMARKRVRAVLAAEQQFVNDGSSDKADFTIENYEFSEAGRDSDGSHFVQMKPRRRDVLLVDGRMVLTADGCDLVRVEGRLSKNPSFWTSLVNVIQHFGRIAGVRVPVATESVVKIRLAGTARFDVVYNYESVNGRPVTQAENRAASPLPIAVQ